MARSAWIALPGTLFAADGRISGLNAKAAGHHLTPAEIEEGVARLACFIVAKTDRHRDGLS